MSENSPRPNTRAQDQIASKGVLGMQQLFADSPVAALSPYRLAKLRGQRLRFDDDYKSPASEREKSKENTNDAVTCIQLNVEELTSQDIPRLIQLLAEKQKLIETMQTALTDLEQQTTRLRSLRRVVNSPASVTGSGRKERTRKGKEKLTETEGEGTPRTPLVEMAIESPMLPVMPSYVNDLVSQIEQLQLEKTELSRKTVPAATTQEKTPQKDKRKELDSVRKQLSVTLRENESLKKQLDGTTVENESLKKCIGAASFENESLKQELDAALFDNESLKKQTVTNTREIELLKKQHDFASEEIESLKVRLDATTKEAESLKQERDATTRQNESLIIQLNAATAEFELLKTHLNAATEENAKLEAQIETTARENSELRNQVDRAAEENTELRKQTDRAAKESVSVKEQFVTTTKENVELKEEICQLNATLSNRSTDSEKRMKELEYEVDELRTALQDVKRIQTSEERLDVKELNAKLTERLNQLTYSVAASERQVALVEEEWLERLRKVTTENQQLKQELVVLTTKASEVAELENENILSLAERNKYEKLYSGALARLEESTGMCETLSERNTRLESKIRELESQVQKYRNRVRTIEQRMADKTRTAREVPAQWCPSPMGHWLRPIAKSISLLSDDRRTVQSEVDSLQRQMKKDVDDIIAKVSSVVQNMTCVNRDLVSKYQREMALRKKLHNELVELKGNIRVFCRIRPVIKEDRIDVGKKAVVYGDQDDNSCVLVDHKDRKLKFDCDQVFDQHSTQQEVFDELKALTVSCVDGFNICIFAYGQTGSGKTYTMEGVPENPGINQRALQDLFHEIELRRPDWTFSICISVLEIYNETLRDLLSDGSTKVERLKVKMTAVGGLEVPGLTWAEVESVEDINEVSTVAQQNRTTAATKMNERSSRSHALLCVSVEGTNRVTGVKTLGKLNLVDLAGSERVHKSGAEGHRLKEAQCINRSLSSLGDVIHALRTKQQHVPYRNSKLTYLLQNSLGGNSKTLMIVQVAPVEDHVSETIASLTFAQRIRSVEMGQATRRTAPGAVPSKERPR